MPEAVEHLDHALAEEFAGKAEAIRRLKTTDAAFRALLERNHDLWKQIQRIQNGLDPAADEALEQLEKQRLAILDQIAARIGAAE